MGSEKRLAKLATYEDLFERMLDAGLLLDKDQFTVLDANEACEGVLGFSRDALIGKKLETFLSPSSCVSLLKELRVSRRRYHPRRFDTLWLGSDSKERTMEIAACSLRLQPGEGQPAEVLQVLIKDVTRERSAERDAEKYLSDLQIANQKLEKLSTTDEMTQLANYRHFRSELEKEHERSFRYGTPYALIFVDIDHFKKLNDTHGHKAGDEVLRQVAMVLRTQCRNTDLPARYGGEEFVVLCAGVPWHGSLILAERIRKGIEAIQTPYGSTQPLGKVTASFGVAGFPDHAPSVNEVLECADEALYEAKSEGRNQIHTASPKLKARASGE